MSFRVYISPSQVDIKRRCFRKWAFQYILGIKPPQTEDQSFGIEGHEIVENWLTKGIQPPNTDVGRTALQGIERGFLPAPGPGLYIEQKVEFLLNDEIVFTGKIDLINPRPTIWEVVDHKFVKSMKYCKDELAALTDPQSVFYTVRMFTENKALEAVDWAWVYYGASGKERPRKPCGSRKVARRLTKQDIKPGWQQFCADAHEMHAAKKAVTHPTQIDYNPTSCDDFGGCPFREICPVDPARRFAANVVAGDLSGGIDILTRSAEISYNVRPTRKEIDMDLLSQLRSSIPQPPAGAAPAPVQQVPGQPYPPSMVNPPEGPTPVQPPPQTSGQVPLFAAAPQQPPPQQFAPPAPQPAPQAFAAPPPQPPPPPPQPVQQATLTVGTPMAASIPIRQSDGKLGGLVVLIDCLKAKGEQGTQLVDVLAPVAADLAKQANVQHWTVINYNSHGAPGSAFLSRAFDEWIQRTRPVGTLLVDSSTMEARAVLEVLTARADVVIRGVR